jgi:hypothetical protein
MDGLSLLCNLHADGPLALRRLRESGVRDLGDVEGLPEETLRACLRSSAGHARRFVEEARQLALRLAVAPLEPEPSASSEEGGFFPYPLPAREEEAGLAWRAPARGNAVRGAEHALRTGLLAGLDADTCARLAARDVHTLEALQGEASLALARSTGIPFATLLDLASQARLALAPGGTPWHELVPEAPRHAPPLSGRPTTAAFPAPRVPRARAADPGSAGPFG